MRDLSREMGRKRRCGERNGDKLDLWAEKSGRRADLGRVKG